jgi:hypothetical protein
MNFDSPYTGFVGISGAYGDGRGFMKQLKEEGEIEHQVVAFYTDFVEEKSTVQFGGWDPAAIAKDTSLKLVSAHDTRYDTDINWNIFLHKVTIKTGTQ